MAKKASLQLVVDALPGVKGLQQFEGAANRATRSVSALASGVRRDFSVIGRVVNLTLAPLKLAAGAFVTLKAVTLAAGVASLKAAADYEMFRQQLRTVIATKKEADRAFAESIAFSVATPFTPAEIIRTRVELEAVGVRGAAAVKSVASAAAAMNREIADVAAAVKSMETEPLRRLGIQLRKTGDEFVFSFRDKVGQAQSIAVTGFENAQKALLDIFDTKYDGGLKKMSITFTGLVSTLKGAAQDLRAQFAGGFLDVAKLFLNDIIQGITNLTQSAQKAGAQLGDELMHARAGLLAAFDVGMAMAKQIQTVLGQEGGVGTVLYEALKAGAAILGEGLVTAIKVSLPIWRLIGTILGQGVTDALYRSGLPFSQMALSHAVGANLATKDLAQLRAMARQFHLPTEAEVTTTPPPSGLLAMRGTTAWVPRSSTELAHDIAAAVANLPVEDQLKYAQFDPARTIAQRTDEAVQAFKDGTQQLTATAGAALQNAENNLAKAAGTEPINLQAAYNESYAARMKEGQEQLAEWRKILEGEGKGAPGGRTNTEGAQELTEATMAARKSVLGMEAALRQEYEALTRTDTSREKAARMVEYETALRLANAGSIEEQHDRLVEYSQELDKLEGQRKLVELADDVGAAWGQTWEDMVFGARSADEAIRGLLVDIARLVYRQTVTEPMANFISNLITTGFSQWGMRGRPAGDVHPEMTNYAHAGWTVGSGAVARRAVNPLLFLGAPKLHGGLNWDEYPAILRYGEDVRTPQQRARDERNRTAKVDLHVHNQSGQQLDFLAGPVVVDQGRLTASVFIRDVQTNGPIARTLRGR